MDILTRYLPKNALKKTEARAQIQLILAFIVLPVILMLIMLAFILMTDIPPTPAP